MNKLIILFLAFAVCACKGDDTTPTDSQQDAIIGSLQGTWAAIEVRKDNALISDFSAFTISITDQDYTTDNGAPVWPISGSFDFENVETENEFIRQDGRLFTAALQDGRLSITIIYKEENARGISGTYNFLLE
jgi:hypothetical protein